MMARRSNSFEVFSKPSGSPTKPYQYTGGKIQLERNKYVKERQQMAMLNNR